VGERWQAYERGRERFFRLAGIPPVGIRKSTFQLIRAAKLFEKENSATYFNANFVKLCQSVYPGMRLLYFSRSVNTQINLEASFTFESLNKSVNNFNASLSFSGKL